MAELLEANKIFYTPYEPKLKNRFIMEISGIPPLQSKQCKDHRLLLTKWYWNT